MQNIFILDNNLIKHTTFFDKVQHWIMDIPVPAKNVCVPWRKNKYFFTNKVQKVFRISPEKLGHHHSDSNLWSRCSNKPTKLHWLFKQEMRSLSLEPLHWNFLDLILFTASFPFFLALRRLHVHLSTPFILNSSYPSLESLQTTSKVFLQRPFLHPRSQNT